MNYINQFFFIQLKRFYYVTKLFQQEFKEMMITHKNLLFTIFTPTAYNQQNQNTDQKKQTSECDIIDLFCCQRWRCS